MTNESSHFRLFVESHQNEGERILDHAPGAQGGKRGEIIVTEDRVVFIRDGFTGETFKQTPVDRLRSVESKSGLMTATLRLDGDDYQFSSDGDCDAIETAVTDLMHDRVQWDKVDSNGAGEEREPRSKQILNDSNGPDKRSGNVREFDSLYERPWYDCTGLVVALTVLFFPVGIIGWLMRRKLDEVGRTHFWHHKVWVWIFTLFPHSAPVGLYGFYRRYTDDSADAPKTEYAGFVVSGGMTAMLVAAFVLMGLAATGNLPNSSYEPERTYASPSGDFSKEEEQETVTVEDDSRQTKAIEGWVRCTERLRGKLKQPGTAEFAPITQVEGGPDASPKSGVWLLTGWIEAENSFGGRTRHSGVCKLKREGDEFKILRAGFAE